MTEPLGLHSVPPLSRRDLRNEPMEGVLDQVERGLRVGLDRAEAVLKRRSIGAQTDRGTWVRVEVRPLAKLAAHGQAGDGVEAAALLEGISKPAWHRAMSWRDPERPEVWRADETDLVPDSPVRSGGPLPGDLHLSDDWWAALNTSLDNLGRQYITRVATPDSTRLTQALVTAELERAFPGQVDTRVTGEDWVPAHADFNWANLTGPALWILDWEDHGLAPRGLDAATLWVDSLRIPRLATRVWDERRADLELRSGKLMALFNCAKILNDTVPAPLREAVTAAAAELVADLQR